MILQVIDIRPKNKYQIIEKIHEIIDACKEMILEGKSICDYPTLCQNIKPKLILNIFFDYPNYFYKYTLEIENSKIIMESLQLSEIDIYKRVKEEITFPIISEKQNSKKTICEHLSGLSLKEIADESGVEKFYRHLKEFVFDEYTETEWYSSKNDDTYFLELKFSGLMF